MGYQCGIDLRAAEIRFTLADEMGSHIMGRCWWVGALFLLTGCVTSYVSVDYAQLVTAYGVDGHVVEKLRTHQPLELEDIRHLSDQVVPDSLTLGYLRQERTIYHLNSEHVQNLREAGVSKEVIDYLLATPAAYPIRVYYPYYRYRPPPYFHYGGWYHYYHW